MPKDGYLCWRCFRAVSCTPYPKAHDQRTSLASDRRCCFHTTKGASLQKPLPTGLCLQGVILFFRQSGTESCWVHLAPRAVTLPRTKILLGSSQVLQWILSSRSPAFAEDWKGRARRKRAKKILHQIHRTPFLYFQIPSRGCQPPYLGPRSLVLMPIIPRV